MRAVDEHSLPRGAVQLKVDPTVPASGIVSNVCRVLVSRTPPCVVFATADAASPPFLVIAKSGGDYLRDDQLILSMTRATDTLWQAAGLDLQLTHYAVVATGPSRGLAEVVMYAVMTAAIQKAHRCGTAEARSAFSEKPLREWLRRYNPAPVAFDRTVDNPCARARATA